MSRHVLVISAHPDDEVLGCGGTLARHSELGDSIATVFLTNGVASRLTAQESDAVRREKAMLDAASLMGISVSHQLDFPDNAIDSVPLLDVVRAIEAFCQEWALPDVVYTHHPSDLNIDHRMAYRAAMTAFRPQPSVKKRPTKMLSFEIPSSSTWEGDCEAGSFRPNYFVDISNALDTKLDAARAYREEMRTWPHARSIEAVEHLARFRGATIGCEAAEAFQIARIIATDSLD